MIDVISNKELGRLVETSAQECVSIYLPTHAAGSDTAQDPIRLKNLLSRAAHELRSLGMRAPEAEELLAPAAALIKEPTFWAHLEDGLAVFLTRDGIWTYRLAESVQELVVVADRLHLKPLLASVASGDVFYILALSQGAVRMLRGSKFRVSEIALGDIPRNLAAALWFDDPERRLQSHSSGRTGRGDVVATFHGQGIGQDTHDDDLRRFLQAVDDGVQHLLATSKAPLVLAGVDDLVATYRKVSRYPRIVEGSVEGNPQRLGPAELHARAWPLVEVVFDQDRLTTIEAFLAATHPTTAALAEATVAAANGQVESLFVPIGVQQWGRLDRDRQLVELHDVREPGDRDLLDIAAIDTLAHGGKVFAVAESDLPGTGPVAAVLRF